MDISWIIERVTSEQYRWSRHGDRERQNDALTLDEVEQALLNGRILDTVRKHGARRELLGRRFR
jgi:hypothetical protein